jgi:hypothetical protein
VIRYKPFKMRARIPRLVLPVAVAAVSSALILAACGSSGKSGSGSGSATASAGIKFADCMRAHGVSDFPDPSSGGGIQLSGSGIIHSRPRSSRPRARVRSCCRQGAPAEGVARRRARSRW